MKPIAAAAADLEECMVSRRVRPFVVLLAAALVTGCRSVPAKESRIDDAKVTRGTRYVSMSDLAYELALDLNEREDGMIELKDPPHSIIFVGEGDRAWVNKQVLKLQNPCMLRGEEYVVTSADAELVRQCFLSTRREVRETPPAIRIAPPSGPSAARSRSGLPSAWRPDSQSVAWKKIVIHHAAAEHGSAAIIHLMHKNRAFDGLGYDFVIGNGTGSDDGEVEVGYRWKRQLVGAHARVHPADDNWWNRYAIGIVLVGDFTKRAPSRRQMAALVRLTRSLMDEYGLDVSDVVPHDHVKATVCPGPHFPWSDFIAQLR